MKVMVFRMKILIVTVLFYYGSCEDSVTVREPPAPPAPPANRIYGGHPTTVNTYPYMAFVIATDFRRFIKRKQADHLGSLDPGQPDGPSDARVNSARKAFLTTAPRTEPTTTPRTTQKLFKNDCGGVILTQHHVLTAAHCLYYIIHDLSVFGGKLILKASIVTIRIGSTYYDRGGSEYVTSKTVVHEKYDFDINDVAVLVLPTSMSNYRSSSVQPAVIPPGGYVVPNNASVVVVGWGLTGKGSKSLPRGLRHVGLRTVDRDTCGARWGKPVPDSMFCAGLLDVGGAGPCKGDSGGPLVYNGVVVGVTSFGRRCEDSFRPHVFTRVASYTAWINNIVRQNRVQPKRSPNSAAAAHVNFRLMLLASVLIIYSKN